MQHLQNLGKKVETVFKEVFGMTQENVDNTPLVADEVVAPVEEEPMVDEVVAEVVAEEVVEEVVAEVVEEIVAEEVVEEVVAEPVVEDLPLPAPDVGSSSSSRANASFF